MDDGLAIVAQAVFFESALWTRVVARVWEVVDHSPIPREFVCGVRGDGLKCVTVIVALQRKVRFRVEGVGCFVIAEDEMCIDIADSLESVVEFRIGYLVFTLIFSVCDIAQYKQCVV